ncbi:MAG: aminotransferase class III-fold pyridoxal phosphate-dependent enzyme [Blastocatellia bacterium]
MTKYINQKPNSEVVQDFADYVSPGKVAIYKQLGFGSVPGKREGIYLWDLDGKRYINCRSSGGVFNLGHRPPRIINALQEALTELDIGDHILMSEHRARLAKRLAEITPGDIRYTFFAPGGGEAVDVAIKLARGFTKRPNIISAEYGYHGHTGFALAAGDPSFSKHFGPLMPGFSRVPFGDIEAMDKAVTDETAAVILETIQATAGMIIPENDYLPAVREICDRKGAVLILDEVQAGLGRTGKVWGCEHWQVVPDILVSGKGMSSAIYPLAVCCFRPHLDKFFQENPFVHLCSFGGSDLACVTSLAMLDQITEEGFLAHVNEMGSKFAKGFENLKAKYPQLVAGYRQLGLMMALDLTDDRLGAMMTLALGKSGILGIFSDFRQRAIQVLPPLIINSEQVDEVLTGFDQALSLLGQMLASGMDTPYIP